MEPAGNSEDRSLLIYSEYLRKRDLQPIECLGRGSYGVVFKAKNMFDQMTYAVKIIELRNTKEDGDWGLREVTALAKLNHKNIVRYFNAWIDYPPKGGLEKKKPLGSASQIGSMSSTADDPSSGPSATDEAKEDSLEIVFEGSSNSNNPPGGLSVDGLDSSSELTGSRSSSIIHSNDENTGDGVELGEEAEVSGSSQAFLFIQQELCQKQTLGEWLMSEEKRAWLRSEEKRVELRSLEMEFKKWRERELCRFSQDQQGMKLMRSMSLLQLDKIKALISLHDIFSQIVDGVEYIHWKGLIHRDLKANNIFLAADSEYSDAVVKIGDFGLARKLADVNVNPSCGGQTEGLTMGVGTELYMSPELERSNLYDYKVDIYSLGVIFFELLNTFGTEMERYTVLSQLKKAKDDKDRFPPNFEGDFPEEHVMILRMISHNPTVRPDATSLKEWVNSSMDEERFFLRG